jgi:hypothetical protein
MLKKRPSVARWFLAAFLAVLATPCLAMEGMWHGTYVCTQGLTGLTMNLTKAPDGQSWTARFCFCAIPENPGLPTGECELSAPIVPGEAKLKFFPGRWIMHPPGWEMRPLQLWLSADGKTIHGEIDAPDCHPPFQLERLADNTVKPRCQCNVVTSQAEAGR